MVLAENTALLKMNKVKATLIALSMGLLATGAHAAVDYSPVTTAIDGEVVAIGALVLGTAVIGLPVWAGLNGISVMKKAAKMFLGR